MRLDAELAAGADPWSTRERFIRAHHLLAPATRETLAQRIDRLLVDASRPGLVIRPAPFQRSAVLDAREMLIAVRGRLRGIEPVGLQGIAAMSHLLADGSGPVYSAGTSESLADAAERIAALLHFDADA